MGRRDYVLKLDALLSSVKKKVEVISANKQKIFILGAGNTTKLHAKCFDIENVQPSGF